MDEFSENLRAAFAPTPPLPFGKKKIITKFFENFSIMEKTGVPYSGTDEGLLFNRKGLEFWALGWGLSFKSAWEEASLPGHRPSNSWADHADACHPVENPYLQQATTNNNKQQQKQSTTGYDNQIWGGEQNPSAQ